MVYLALPGRFVCSAAPIPDADSRTAAQGQKSPQPGLHPKVGEIFGRFTIENLRNWIVIYCVARVCDVYNVHTEYETIYWVKKNL